MNNSDPCAESIRLALKNAPVLFVLILCGCAQNSPSSLAPNAPASVARGADTSALKVPSGSEIITQRRALLEKRLEDVQNNSQLSAEAKTQAVDDLKKQIAQLSGK